jgi:integrase/recombinase XerC
MPLVGRPKIAKTLPKGLPANLVQALLAAIDSEPEQRASDWVERDRALILTSVLSGRRADELLRANIGDVRRSDDGAFVHVRGKGGKGRRIPVEPTLVKVLEDYLDARAVRFPNTAKRRSSPVFTAGMGKSANKATPSAAGQADRGALDHPGLSLVCFPNLSHC